MRMFGRQSALVGSSGGSGGPLVEFRAGRMNMVGKMVHADTRKGLVYVLQAEDGLIHFCWKDRVSGKVEDDLIVFPDDCEFKRVEQCKTGRVFVLKFKSSSRRLLFWLQEPKTDKDEEYCRRVNEVLNNPPSANNRSGSDSGDLHYMLNNMSQQQLMQLFGGVGQMGGLSSLLGSMNRSSDGNSSSRTSTTPASNRSATTAAGGAAMAITPENSTVLSRTPSAPKANRKGNSGTSRVTLPDLQSYLSALSPEATGAAGGRSVSVDLSSAIATSEAVGQIIADPEKASALSSHLPNTGTNEPAKQQLKETITSPQFQQALSLFSSALQSGQLGPVVSQFQLSSEAVAAANTGDLEQFVKALEKSPKKDESNAEEQQE